MTRAERLLILGAEAVAMARREAAAQPAPTPELIRKLQSLFNDPTSYVEGDIPAPVLATVEQTAA